MISALSYVRKSTPLEREVKQFIRMLQPNSNKGNRNEIFSVVKKPTLSEFSLFFSRTSSSFVNTIRKGLSPRIEKLFVWSTFLFHENSLKSTLK